MHKYFTGLSPLRGRLLKRQFPAITQYIAVSYRPFSPTLPPLSTAHLSLDPRRKAEAPRQDAGQAGRYGSFAISAIAASSIFPSTKNGGGEQRRRNAAAAVAGLHVSASSRHTRAGQAFDFVRTLLTPSCSKQSFFLLVLSFCSLACNHFSFPSCNITPSCGGLWIISQFSDDGVYVYLCLG